MSPESVWHYYRGGKVCISIMAVQSCYWCLIQNFIPRLSWNGPIWFTQSLSDPCHVIMHCMLWLWKPAWQTVACRVADLIPELKFVLMHAPHHYFCTACKWWETRWGVAVCSLHFVQGILFVSIDVYTKSLGPSIHWNIKVMWCRMEMRLTHHLVQTRLLLSKGAMY